MPEAGLTAIDDPRRFFAASAAREPGAALHAQATQSLAALTGDVAASCDREIRATLAGLQAGDGEALARAFAEAPSVDVVRHLWRLLEAAWRDADAHSAGSVALTIFAMPILVVAARTEEGASTIAGTLREPDRLTGILREHGALRGNRNFGLSDALVGASAIDLARLPSLLRAQRVTDAGVGAGGSGVPSAPAFDPAPFAVDRPEERVHLRFLIGSAIAKSGWDLFDDPGINRWGMAFASELGRQLASPGASILVLPRAPHNPLAALPVGQAAQREVAAQIFASNAIRRVRASVGEPVAVVSAHRAADAPGGGELRLSLTSPFDARDAEGFRCPLHPLDRVDDVLRMLTTLLADCRVGDVRIVAGVHADRDPATGLPLFYRPETIPADAAAQRH